MPYTAPLNRTYSGRYAADIFSPKHLLIPDCYVRSCQLLPGTAAGTIYKEKHETVR
jgi:hypothetical protein